MNNKKRLSFLFSKNAMGNVLNNPHQLSSNISSNPESWKPEEPTLGLGGKETA